MKIPEQPAPSSVNRRSEPPEESKSSTSFSKTLDEKKKTKDKTKDGEEKAGQVPPGLLPQQGKLGQAGKVQGPQGAAPLPAVERLAEEIVLIDRGADVHEVHIQFDSKTLNGLRVQLLRQDGAVSIRFLTRSEDTAQLLAHHIPQLTQSLEAKGIQLGAIQLQTPHRREDYRREEGSQQHQQQQQDQDEPERRQ